MEKVKITDNFLDNYSFEQLRLALLPNNGDSAPLNWSFGGKAGGNTGELKNFQFYYIFYKGYPNLYCDNNYHLVEPILYKIPDIYQLARIKANLEPHSEEQYFSAWHWDMAQGQDRDDNNVILEEGTPIKNTRIGILYLNTNNGYTELDDGTKVDCVKNRFLTFPNEMKHRGISTNDTMFKSVINIVYVGLQ